MEWRYIPNLFLNSPQGDKEWLAWYTDRFVSRKETFIGLSIVNDAGWTDLTSVFGT
jgi:hypothetical protein